MNDDIKLPSLPTMVVIHTVMPDDYRYGNVHGYLGTDMKNYARKAVIVDRETRKEIAMIDDIDLPEPDFYVDSGDTPCWYVQSVRAAILADREARNTEPTSRERDMAMLIRRLVLDVRALADDEGPEAVRLTRANKTLDYLRRHGLDGEVMRDEGEKK